MILRPFFKYFSHTSGSRLGYNERLYATEPRLRLEARAAGQPRLNSLKIGLKTEEVGGLNNTVVNSYTLDGTNIRVI